MKRYSMLTTVGLPLLGLLGIAAAMMAMGQREVEAFPAIESNGPSGTSVFAELLRRDGYEVVADRTPSPKLHNRDLAIAFPLSTENEFAAPKTPDGFDKLEAFVDKGGHALVIPLQQNFQAASRTASNPEPTRVTRGANTHPLGVTFSETSWSDGPLDQLSMGPDPIDVWRGQDAVVRAGALGKGQIWAAVDGIGLTNRFIDQNDNADFYLAVVHAAAPRGTKIVFTEASFGNARSPSLTSMMGRWASVAWYQFIFLFLVVVFTLGKRFGEPERDRTTQKGSRELVDAVAMTFRRAGMGKAALAAAAFDADTRIRSVWRIPRDASEGERNRVLPEELLNLLLITQEALKEPKLSPVAALGLARSLDKAVADAISDHRKPVS